MSRAQSWREILEEAHVTFYPELDNLSLEQLINCFDGPPLVREKYAFVYFSEVAFRIRQQGEAGNDFLLRRLEEAEDIDSERLRAILCGLTFSPDEKVRSLSHQHEVWLVEQLVFYLQDKRPLIAAEAIDGLWLLDKKDALDHVLALREHSSPYVRGAVLRYLSNLYPDKAVPWLLEGLTDSHYVVRENAVDELDYLGVVEAIPQLRPLLIDPHPHVRQATRTAIETLEASEG